VKGGKPGAGQGSFGHIVGGYDAGYYGYTYSLVFAADMYATIFKADPLDPSCGARYRRSILQPGGSREEHDSLKVRVMRLCACRWLLELKRRAGIPGAASELRGVHEGVVWVRVEVVNT
jgi:Zn-dependent oligopeptidase